MPGETARAGLELVHGPLTREIIDAYYDVYNALGFGFVESIYQRALPLRLKARGIRSEREVPLNVMYLGESIGAYRADLVVEGKIIVECKVAAKILPIHEIQTVNYLRATAITVALIFNFGPEPSFRRLVLSFPRENSAPIRC
jgi:GxxExxY protein